MMIQHKTAKSKTLLAGIVESFVMLMLLAVPLSVVEARTWRDIEVRHVPSSSLAMDPNFVLELQERDPFFLFTKNPSLAPTLEPTTFKSDDELTLTSSPSLEPSVATTESSVSPSIRETDAPIPPTTSPTTRRRPTATPTSPRPTESRYPPNPVPPSQMRAGNYFNYDDSFDAMFGPGYPQTVAHNATLDKIVYQNNAWATLDVTDSDTPYYWSEFDTGSDSPWEGILSIRRVTRNRCQRVGLQSPIDVRPSPSSICYEHHQIRNRRGDFSLRGMDGVLGTSLDIVPQILPNKLRLLMRRRPCADVSQETCAEPDPPHADFPHQWGGYTDVMHVDFKIPSEHLLYGERFDAEMQIYHLHVSRRRMPTPTVLIQASHHYGINGPMQQIIDAFQSVYAADQQACFVHQQGGRSRELEVANSTSSRAAAEEENDEKQRHRNLQGIFTPYHPDLMPGIHFYGYSGSLTDPPCGEWVHWFVMEEPMKISLGQLEELKRIQFSHVDGRTCQPTSVHYQESNARPIQDSFGRHVYHCTASDFLADP